MSTAAQLRAGCQRCGQPVAKRRARFCSKRCASLVQNETRRASGEDERRFWSKVERGGTGECWPWTGGTTEGYGQIRFRGQKLGSHVVSYVLASGDVPAGKMVLHRCGNRLCCNPDHLYAGTHADNTNDAIRHGTYRTIFVPGHPPYRSASA